MEHSMTDATDPSPEATHAAIWILDPYKLNEIAFKERVTPSIEGGQCAEFVEPAFRRVDEPAHNACAAMAAEADIRMIMQQGCFTIHTSNQASLNQVEGHGRFLRAFTIATELLDQFAGGLSASGIRQADLFPDLGHLASELKHTYRHAAI